MTTISIAFIPLTDCAILAVAKEKGFAAKAGIDLKLIRDTSWATVRDRLVYGQVQAAHFLAPLAVAVSLGLSQTRTAIAAPFKLNVNGNSITFSRDLAGAVGGDPIERVLSPAATVHRLKAALPSLRRKPVLGVVHRFSSQALALRYWLAFARIDPDAEVELRVVPPPLMADALLAGELDGFSVGDPYNSIAVEAGGAEIVATGSRIWESAPEKVLAMREDWLEAKPELADRLLVALDRSAAWADDPANHGELSTILARENYIGKPATIIARALAGLMTITPERHQVSLPNYLHLHKHAANFPWRSQALWIYSQFVRWEHIAPSEAAEKAASRVFRSDIYRRALAKGSTPLPAASLKVEGSLPVEMPVSSPRGNLTLSPDRFFDGQVFDPANVGEYIARQRKSLNQPL